MRNQLLAATALLALISVPALADEPSAKTDTSYQATSNGGFDEKATSKVTEPDGTALTHEVKKSVDVNSDGSSTATTEVKDSTDPKGLFNKTTVTSKKKVTVKNGKAHVKTTKTVNGKTVEKTDVTVPASTVEAPSPTVETPAAQ